MVEFSSCGVGFLVNLSNERNHANLELALKALINLEHRGGTAPPETSNGDKGIRAGDGAGLMTDIPYELFGIGEGDAVASLFLPRDPTARVRSLAIFEETFRSLGLDVLRYREVPVDTSVLARSVEQRRPDLLMAFVRRPPQCSTRHTFEKMLYAAKQLVRIKLREAGIRKQFFFTSLSAGCVVYKALTPSDRLAEFFLDLKNPDYKTRWALFHRRFSTNTATAWDTAQPFRMVAHNGEINTISGNRAWAYARERALGLSEDELLTHRGISDSGTVNEIIEALMYRSSIPHPEDILAIMMPKADNDHPYYRFWRRAMEPWDGPALFVFSDGRTVGARLDRSGFRPCRWKRTKDYFVLSSEAGSFELPESEVLAKGSLSGGGSVSVEIKSGLVHFKDASHARENLRAVFDPRLVKLNKVALAGDYAPQWESKLKLFGFTEEDIEKVLLPLIRDGKEGVGSMGDTARVPAMSSETRSLFDCFHQGFAQVTNPPLDYLREKIVTDMTVILGRKPNIFEPKELIPLKLGIENEGPVLTLGQLEFLKTLDREEGFEGHWPASCTFDTSFNVAEGVDGFLRKVRELQKATLEAVKDKVSIIVLSDRKATPERPAIPIVLAVAALVRCLEAGGMRLRASIVADTGEVKDPHSLAVTVGFGAAAVCPYVPLELARFYPKELFGEAKDSPDEREERLVRALSSGLLKIMSKMGVSVLQSYQGAELFSILGLGGDIHREFFPAHGSRAGGLSLDRLVQKLSRPHATKLTGKAGLLHNYLYKEHPKNLGGERHAVTIARSKLIHKLVAETGHDITSMELFDAYLKNGTVTEPVSFRHLLRPRPAAAPLPIDSVQPRGEILATFGSGAMSFGAISAEAQRDIILAMKEVGGRSNSGEGGENPFYFTENITAHTKQVASGRFGVTAEYLTSGKEIQIKICQGAKPGEGGQLMAVKVNADIARARHSEPGVDLISPPPMHDIYSIEDLKQLIYELRQLKPEASVSVKLTSGENVGTIAVGVAKAGADVIHIAGHDGGTGAAPLSSMKHAGLPWELGLAETHRALSEHGLRAGVTVRVDGGLATGRDIVTAAMLGAEEFDFGKLLLLAEGCIMARVCEKNTCPTGITTHDPKFKRLYRGSKDKVVKLLNYLAEDVRRELAKAGAQSIRDVVGRRDLLEPDPAHRALAKERGISLVYFLGDPLPVAEHRLSLYREPVCPLNTAVLKDVRFHASQPGTEPVTLAYSIRPGDRAALATVNGALAAERARRRFEGLDAPLESAVRKVSFVFRGSAGQGFAVFLQDGFNVRLEGEANDSVAKSMSGGEVVVVPNAEAKFAPHENTIIGNCALYGATGGTLFVHGIAGNRFAVRNSGATAVVEGVGMHACEYMTRGRVLILGHAGINVGAGMTGGILYLPRGSAHHVNQDFLSVAAMSEADQAEVKELIERFFKATGSSIAAGWLEHWEARKEDLVKATPYSSRACPKPSEPASAQGIIVPAR